MLTGDYVTLCSQYIPMHDFLYQRRVMAVLRHLLLSTERPL